MLLGALVSPGLYAYIMFTVYLVLKRRPGYFKSFFILVEYVASA